MNRASGIFALIIALAITAFSVTSTQAGEVLYRWNDAGGNPVHSDRPPPKGIDYEVISTDSSMIRTVDSEEGVVPREIEPSVGNDFETVAAKPSKVKRNPENCARARSNIETLNSSAKIQMRDENGDPRYLTEEELATQRKKAVDIIGVHCE